MLEQPLQQFILWIITILFCLLLLVYTFVWNPMVIRRAWRNKKKQNEQDVRTCLTINYLFLVYVVLWTTLPYIHESYQAWSMELGWKIQT